MLKTTINAYTYWNAKPKFLLDSDTEHLWVMYVIESGACDYSIAGQKGQAVRGDILVCPPGVPFARKVESPLSFHFFRFALNNDMIPPTQLIGQRLQADSRIFDDCNLIHRYEFDYATSTDAIKDHLLTDIFFSVLYRKDVHCDDLTRTNPDIAGVIHYIDENYAKSMRLTDLARRANLSPEYLSRKFHKVVGKSLSNFIEDVRLQHAQELLINTRLTLDEIAAQVGYADGLYFSRKFHDSTQQWPRMFRAQHIL